MIGKIFIGLLVAIFAVLVAAIVVSIPDIKRYRELRDM
jgi:hypothetical protein